ncbi:hypothetical protein ACFL17_02745 [Pseudomonadota bacterium]
MSKLLTAIILTALLNIPAYAEDDTCEMLFVQDANGMSYKDGQLTLKRIHPTPLRLFLTM